VKKSLIIPLAGLLVLSVLAGGLFSQSRKKPEIVGTWVGYANAQGMRFDLTAVIDRNEAGYTGKLSDASGAIAETPLRQIVFQDGKLTSEFDVVLGGISMLIKFELALENEVLKGLWLDTEGNSDVVELTLQK
jgi:hypothetical protein